MNKKYLSLIIITFFGLLFFLFIGKNWLYLDNSGFPITFPKYLNDSLIVSFFSLSTATSFGFDNAIITSSRAFGLLFQGIGNFPLYGLFFLVSFFSTYFLLRNIFSKKSSIIGALIYTFNPISLYFLNLTGFIFAYTSLPLVLIFAYQIIDTKKYIYIFGLIISSFFLISYTRTLGLYFVFLLLLGLYFWKSLWKFFKENIIYSLGVISVLFLANIPFFFALIYPRIDGQKEYFGGLGNYAEKGSGWAGGLYNSILSTPFYQKLSFSEIIGNFVGDYHNSLLFVTISFFLIIGFFIYSFLITGYKHKKFHRYISSLFLIFTFLLVSPYFVSEAIFGKITYTYFPFIANNTDWLYVLLLPIFVFIVSFSIENTKNQKNKNFICIIASIYVCISLFPLLNFVNNPKLSTVQLADFPHQYRETFHENISTKEAALFLPWPHLYFSWTPYYINIGNNNNYRELFSGNSRLVNGKQAQIYNLVKNKVNYENIENLNLFNLKNIFVFKQVQNVEKNQFDYYPVKNYVKLAERGYNFFSENSNYLEIQDGESFTQFSPNNSENFDFKLYTPSSLVQTNIKSFFETPLNIYKRPIILDEESFHKPKEMDTFQFFPTNQNIQIGYKYSNLNPTKYYIKLSNVDTNSDFLLQLNQTFGMSWKLKWITKGDYLAHGCISDPQWFSITNNASCEYQSHILDISDTKYLYSSYVPEKNHFEGNFVGNTWLVHPENIPTDMRDGNELYAVLIYEKQIWYNWMLIISFSILGLLIILSIIQEIQLYKKRKKNEN